MSSAAARLRRLIAGLDLGEYEVTLYLTALEHGELTASEAAEVADIPQPRVYDTARELRERGLVEVDDSRPFRIVAVDPGVAFAELRSAFESTVEALESHYTAPPADTAAASLVKSRANVLRNLGEVIEAAEYELAVALTPDLVDRFGDSLADAVDRGVRVDLVVAPAADAPPAAAFDYGAIATVARARRGVTTPVLAVADGERSIYTTREAVDGGGDRFGVVFTRSVLGFLVLGFFSTVLWTTAESLHEPASEPSFPRRYASIRRCVREVAEVETPLRATVTGREVLTGDAVEVTGTITTTRVTDDGRVATLDLDTPDGTVSVGGRVATYEDIEAHEIAVEPAD